MTRNKKPDSVFTPIGKHDVLTAVDVYQRTEDRHDQRALLVCHFKRPQRDVARAMGRHSEHFTETRYVKIGPAPFSVHSDASGMLSFNVDGHNGGFFGHFMTQGITQIRVTSFSTHHNSESGKRAGIRAQNLTFATKKGEFSFMRHDICGEWWETADHYASKVFPFMRHDFYWRENGTTPIVWVGGETLEAIRLDQVAGARAEQDTIATLERYRRDQAERDRTAAVAKAAEAGAADQTKEIADAAEVQ